jgi:hypothetical protein
MRCQAKYNLFGYPLNEPCLVDERDPCDAHSSYWRRVCGAATDSTKAHCNHHEAEYDEFTIWVEEIRNDESLYSDKE